MNAFPIDPFNAALGIVGFWVIYIVIELLFEFLNHDKDKKE